MSFYLWKLIFVISFDTDCTLMILSLYMLVIKFLNKYFALFGTFTTVSVNLMDKLFFTYRIHTCTKADGKFQVQLNGQA